MFPSRKISLIASRKLLWLLQEKWGVLHFFAYSAKRAQRSNGNPGNCDSWRVSHQETRNIKKNEESLIFLWLKYGLRNQIIQWIIFLLTKLFPCLGKSCCFSNGTKFYWRSHQAIAAQLALRYVLLPQHSWQGGIVNLPQSQASQVTSRVCRHILKNPCVLELCRRRGDKVDNFGYCERRTWLILWEKV